jgi:ABC-type multidrug transport system ATPase subunit
LMRYSQPFYPDWDQAYAEELGETFELDSLQKIKTLSKGQRAPVAGCAAVCRRTAGMDFSLRRTN